MICNFPGCRCEATKTFALVSLCEEHYDDVWGETYIFYEANRYRKQKDGVMRPEERYFYNKIKHLTPFKEKEKKR